MASYCSDAATYCGGGSLNIFGAVFTAGVCVALIAIVMLAWCYIRRLCRSNLQVRNIETASVAMATTNPTSPYNQRLDAEILASLPTFVYSSATHGDKLDCAVCLMEFKNGEKGRRLPRCGHRFHAECVDMWLDSHSTCPYCRAVVGSDDVSQLPI